MLEEFIAHNFDSQEDFSVTNPELIHLIGWSCGGGTNPEVMAAWGSVERGVKFLKSHTHKLKETVDWGEIFHPETVEPELQDCSSYDDDWGELIFAL